MACFAACAAGSTASQAYRVSASIARTSAPPSQSPCRPSSRRRWAMRATSAQRPEHRPDQVVPGEDGPDEAAGGLAVEGRERGRRHDECEEPHDPEPQDNGNAGHAPHRALPYRPAARNIKRHWGNRPRHAAATAR